MDDPTSPSRYELDVAVAALAGTDAATVAASWSSEVHVEVLAAPPDVERAARHHIVVGVADSPVRPVKEEHDAIDTWTDVAGARSLLLERLVPFRENLTANRRAPRRRVAELIGPDPTWPAQARRLIARVGRVLGDAALRIDHIGSTSVPGLPAKNIVDIQVVVADLGLGEERAAHAREGGFVRVPGRWFGLDRDGARFDEVVLVDADPGRPVTVNLRPVADPVWRETLLFRDWLRADDANRDRYLALKRHLAATTSHVDDYSDGKQTWVGEALDEATRWASEVGWQADAQSRA